MKFFDVKMPDYVPYDLAGTKQKKSGRYSGGIKVYVKHNIDQYFKRVHSAFKHGVILLVDKSLMGENMIWFFVYLPPEGSTSYCQNEPNGVVLLEEELVMIQTLFPDHKLIISGDLNARTRNEADYIIDDSITYLPVDTGYSASCFNKPRNSQDLHGELNNHGKSLLELCKSQDLHFLNGRTNGDLNGDLTCFTQRGSSTVDYTIVSADLFDNIVKFEILSNDCFTHLPQLFSINCVRISENASVLDDLESENMTYRLKFKWCNKSVDRLLSEKVNNCVEDFYRKVDQIDVLGAVDEMTEMLQYVCQNKTNSHKPGVTKPMKSTWWDDELEDLRKVKYKRLRALKTMHTTKVLDDYRYVRNKYKKLIRQKKLAHKLSLKIKLENCTSTNEFWKEIHSYKNPSSCMNKISSQIWKDYFQILLNTDNTLNIDHSQHVKEYMLWHDSNCDECKNGALNLDFNRDFSIAEVEYVVQHLPNNKSPGIDGINNECLKQCSNVITPLLCTLFNKILESGVFPDSWCEAIIVPIYKNGSIEMPSNYRGIALLSCLSKIFTKIVNNRLIHWAKENNKLFEIQAGFTKGKSTRDQIFILQALINKYISKKKGRCYNVFIDFSKAFDTVPHLHMFYRFLSEGAHGRVIQVLRNMYSKLKSCVQVGNIITEMFNCEIGTRQGCMLSPFCFIFYLNEYINMCIANECKGIYVNNKYMNVNMLLYADDIVLIGDTVGSVQKLLDVLAEFCDKWGLQVNMLKTKVLVYRNGGIIKNNEKFFFGKTAIENVSYYKYLGVLFSTRLSWTPAQSLLASQGLKAMYTINKLNYECEFPFKVSKELFVKCVLPIITYGSEVWGIKATYGIENVLIKFCRQQLGVGSKTPTVAVLGECGIYPVFLTCYVNALKYWIRILSLPENNLVRACYDMLYAYQNNGRKNWAADIKTLLYSYGFGYIWEQQHINIPAYFINEFTERIHDVYRQTWSEMKANTSKLSLYNLFKQNFQCEIYLCLDVPFRLRKYLSKLRISCTSLEIEKGRQEGIPKEDRLCKICVEENLNKVEDEFHVLLECPAYSDARNIYLGPLDVTLYSFCSLMSTNDRKTLINLGNFVCNVYEIRKNLSILS